MPNKICEDAIRRQLDKIHQAQTEVLESFDGKLPPSNPFSFFQYELTTLKPLVSEARDGLLPVEEFSNVASEMLRKLNAVSRLGDRPKDGYDTFSRAVDDLRKMLLVRSRGGDFSALVSALAIQDATSELHQKLDKLIDAEKWEYLEFTRVKKSKGKSAKRSKKKKKVGISEAEAAEAEGDEIAPTFEQLLDHLKAAGTLVSDKAQDLVDDLLRCTDCEDLHEDCEELDEALSALRCLYCEILCDVDFQEGGEQPAAFLDLKADLAGIGVAIELALWEFDKISLQKKSYSARLQPVLAQVSTGVQAIQSAITRWAGARLFSGPVYTAATSDISAQLQKLSNAVGRLGSSESCDSLRALLPLVDGVSQSLRALYCKDLPELDKRVFFQPWSLLVQVRCILEPCCEEDDECDDLKTKLSRFFCLWQDLNTVAPKIDCEEIFEKDDCCCTTSAGGTAANTAPAALSAPQVNAALQQFQQVATQAAQLSVISQAQVQQLNEMLPATSAASLPQTAAAARITLARYGGALSALLAEAADTATQRCVGQPSAQQGQLATLQYQLGQALQIVQGIN